MEMFCSSVKISKWNRCFYWRKFCMCEYCCRVKMKKVVLPRQLVDCWWWIGQWSFVMCRLKVNGIAKQLFIVVRCSICLPSNEKHRLLFSLRENLALTTKLGNEMIWRSLSVCEIAAQIDFVKWRDATFERIWWEKQRQQLFNKSSPRVWSAATLSHQRQCQHFHKIVHLTKVKEELVTHPFVFVLSFLLSFFRWKHLTWL